MPQPAIISFLADYGFYEVFLPFVLVFAILYGILSKTQILGRNKKQINIMVSIAISLIAVGSLQFSGILKEFVAKLGFAIVILLGLSLFISLFGVPLDNKITFYIAFFMFIAIVYLQFANDTVNNILSSFLTSGFAIFLVIVILVVWLLVKSPKEKQQEEPSEKKPKEKPVETPGVPKVNLEEYARLKKGSQEFEELFGKEGSELRKQIEKSMKK